MCALMPKDMWITDLAEDHDLRRTKRDFIIALYELHLSHRRRSSTKVYRQPSLEPESKRPFARP